MGGELFQPGTHNFQGVNLIESSLPMGHPRRQASAGSTTLAPGRATRMVPLVTGSVQMISEIVQNQSNLLEGLYDLQVMQDSFW